MEGKSRGQRFSARSDTVLAMFEFLYNRWAPWKVPRAVLWPDARNDFCEFLRPEMDVWSPWRMNSKDWPNIREDFLKNGLRIRELFRNMGKGPRPDDYGEFSVVLVNGYAGKLVSHGGIPVINGENTLEEWQKCLPQTWRKGTKTTRSGCGLILVPIGCQFPLVGDACEWDLKYSKTRTENAFNETRQAIMNGNIGKDVGQSMLEESTRALERTLSIEDQRVIDLIFGIDPPDHRAIEQGV